MHTQIHPQLKTSPLPAAKCLALEETCLLDSEAEQELSSLDLQGHHQQKGSAVKYFLVGGILGNVDEMDEDRTSELRCRNFGMARNLGRQQMTADTAAIVTWRLLTGHSVNECKNTWDIGNNCDTQNACLSEDNACDTRNACASKDTCDTEQLSANAVRRMNDFSFVDRPQFKYGDKCILELPFRFLPYDDCYFSEDASIAKENDDEDGIKMDGSSVVFDGCGELVTEDGSTERIPMIAPGIIREFFREADNF